MSTANAGEGAAGEATMIERVLAEIQRGIDVGMTLPEACADALSWIKREGLAEEVLAACGPRMLADFWRARNHAAREFSMAPEPGERRVNARTLNNARSLYETLWPVGGRFKRLGDFISSECKEVADRYELLASSNSAKAGAFRRLQRRLTGAATVREKISLKALRAIFKDVGYE